MPEVIEIRPKGIYVKVEYSLEELQILVKAMDMIEVRANLKNPEEKEAHDYFTGEFYPFTAKIVEDLKDGP